MSLKKVKSKLFRCINTELIVVRTRKLAMVENMAFVRLGYFVRILVLTLQFAA